MSEWWHGLGGLASGDYRQPMSRPALTLVLLLLAACGKPEEAPQGNQQAVIDKANADVAAAATDAAEAPPQP